MKKTTVIVDCTLYSFQAAFIVSIVLAKRFAVYSNTHEDV